MTQLDALKKAVHTIASAADSPVASNEAGTVFAFPTPQGLCLIGVTALSKEEGYVDIRLRVFIGVVTAGFSAQQALHLNHTFPDTPYGVAELGEHEVLTITDTYRFLTSWSPEKTESIVRVRFGGAFLAPLALPGIAPIPDDLTAALLSEGFDRLLGIGPS